MQFSHNFGVLEGFDMKPREIKQCYKEFQVLGSGFVQALLMLLMVMLNS